MIVFCTHCWAEIDSGDERCRSCGTDCSADSRSYEDKLLAALMHPLPEARARICWLLGDKQIVRSAPRLIELAEHDQDLFVQRAAIESLGVLRDARALPMLRVLSQGRDSFLRPAAEKSLEEIELAKGRPQ